MTARPTLRFAPSPNGRLHAGHAFSALFADHWARRLGGTCLLRIEDIDRARCRPEFVGAILEDLAWLGLSYPDPVRRQSDHFADYAAAAETLRAKGVLYPCFCTRAEIRAEAGPATDPDGAPIYPGTCRALGPAERAARLAAGEPVQWRLDMARAQALTGPLAFAETQPDPASPTMLQPADPSRWGDVVIVRKDTPTSYHLAVVVDDALQGITHVTRGMDLYAATEIHRTLQALLGLPSPLYCHHRLLLDPERHKLAKSRGSQSLAALRAAGIAPAAIRRQLGF